MGFNPQIWSAETARQMKKALERNFRVHASVIDYTKFTKNARAEGYNGPFIGDIEAMPMPIADGDFNALDKQNVNFLFDQEYGVPVTIKDVDEAQSNLALRTEYAKKASNGLINAYDLFIIKQILDNIDSTHLLKKDDSENNKLTEKDFKEARKLLNAAGAPLEDRYAVLNVDDESDLTSIDNFISRDKMGDATLPQGIVGKAYGFLITLEPKMPLVLAGGRYDTGGGTKKVDLFYQKNVFGWGRQKEFGTKIEPKAGSAADMINIWSNWGGKIHAPKFGVSIRDNATT